MPYANVNGVRMYYERSGKGQPLILITGLAGTVDFWKNTVPMLSDRFDVIAIDNRGVGRTEWRGSFSIDDMADDVVSLMDDIGVRSAHILGWSMGSHIALDVASRYSARVRTLTIVSSYLKRPARSKYILDSLSEWYSKGAVTSDMAGTVLNTMLRTEGFFKSAEDRGRKIRTADMPSPEGFRAQMEAVKEFDPVPYARNIKVPTFSVHGLEDIMTEPRAGDAVASMIEGCEILRLPDEGHLIRPESYIPAFRRFALSHEL